MTPDEALDLLGETADGFGPEADQAYDIVKGEIDNLRKVNAETHDLLQAVLRTRDEWRMRADRAEVLLQRLRRESPGLPDWASVLIEDWWKVATQAGGQGDG